ncbi:MAG: hydantoinase B/oxoprolinase family protein [Actinobacteria bacterium]|nr:hydantoinase B/oxoprolinase family protein [Actinomycetota bacterium]
MSEDRTGYASDFDPITLAVMANRVDGVCRQMTNTLLRSARSSVLAVAKDFSCSIISADNDLIAAAEGLPVHVIGSEALAEAMTELHPDMREGDAFLHNDPYLGNTHAADHTILVPVFFEGEHVFTTCAKAHQADCGNALPSTYMPTAIDVYAEGAINFPCVKVQRDHQDVDDIIRMAKTRIRVPDQWYGDYLASLGAARVGERALKDLCAKYGLELVRAWIKEWLDYSEWRMVQTIRSLPAGELTGHTFHDPFPGMPEGGLPLNVTVRIDPEEARVELDLRDNPDSTPNGMNQSRTTAINNAIAGLCFSIEEVPHNSGAFRRIDVQLRENCVAGIPVHPTSCSMATANVGSRIINMTQAAFADLGEGYGLAEGANGYPPMLAVVSGEDHRPDGGGQPYVSQLFLATLGGPGGPFADGWLNYLQATGSGSLFIDSVEADERKYPFVVRERRVRTDSGGVGWRRGAPGSISTYGPVGPAPLTCNYSLDGKVHPPQGVRGGGPGWPNEAFLVDAEGEEVEQPDLVVQIDLEPGELIGSRTTGGGGYGDPFRREPERVLADVVEGFVSPAAAGESYGVVLSGDPGRVETLAVDLPATEARRATGSPTASRSAPPTR